MFGYEYYQKVVPRQRLKSICVCQWHEHQLLTVSMEENGWHVTNHFGREEYACKVCIGRGQELPPFSELRWPREMPPHSQVNEAACFSPASDIESPSLPLNVALICYPWHVQTVVASCGKLSWHQEACWAGQSSNEARRQHETWLAPIGKLCLLSIVGAPPRAAAHEFCAFSRIVKHFT